jgi:hypothetical protein
MKNALLDIWADLQEKRLLPVAALLLAGLIAVPLVVLKPAKEAPATPTAEAGPTAPAALPKEMTAAVVNGAKPLVAVSTLDQFSSKDPFKPLVALTDGKLASASTAGKSAATSSGSGLADTGSSGGGSTSTPAPKTKDQTTTFTYVVDVNFGKSGKAHRVNGLRKLEMLPNQNTPLLVFLGVQQDGKTAVFMVDGTLNQAGEGTCKPSVNTCNFVKLTVAGDNNEHFFTQDNGTEYSLHLIRIRRVEVSKAGQSSSAAAIAHAAVGEHVRAFSGPFFADLQTSAEH